jgi:GTP cyclohydrolase I
VREIIIAIGEDPEREGLVGTPARVARMYEEILGDNDFAPTVFTNPGYDEMVVEREMPFYSLCEHHMLPFFGKVSVAYLPGDKIIGLSKIPRLVDVFARRLQVQERLTDQIAKVLEEILDPRGVAVAVTGFHLCMAMRGVEKQASMTTTTAFTGYFEKDRDQRKEFLTLIQPGGNGAL